MPSGDTFFAARTRCTAWDPAAYLVVVETAAEANFLMGHLQPNTWIGLDDLTVAGTFQWVNGAPLTYTAWQTGNPSDARG